MCASLWRNRSLVAILTAREIVGRYKGSVLGIFWSFFHPLFMLSVYTFVFSVVFKARWGGGTGTNSEFALILFAGLIVFNLFAECFTRAPNLILSNVNFVKKVVFPLEILPWAVLGTAVFHAAVSVAVWLAAYCLLYGTPHATVLCLPLVLFPLCLLAVGCAWILSSLGVYLRDVSQIVGVLNTVLMFVSAVFYPLSALPEPYRKLLLLNPLIPAIEQARNVLFWGVPPDWSLLGVQYAVATGIAWLGFAWFQKTRKGFADVL